MKFTTKVAVLSRGTVSSWFLFFRKSGVVIMSKSFTVKKLVLGAMFLAIALVLPFLTGQIPQFGQALCPMHFPVLLAGYVCGGPVAMIVGFIAPILRFFIFGMPPIFPTGIAMAFELAAYGIFSGLFYKIFPKNIIGTYCSLLTAMILGRIVWGIVTFVITMVNTGSDPFTFSAFISGSILGSVPGIIAQIVLVPVIVLALKKAKLIEE